MKNKSKLAIRLIALVMALAMILAAAGCSNGEQGGPSSSQPESNVTDGSDPNSDGDSSGSQEAGSGPYGLDPNNPVELSCFFNFTWYGIDDWSGIIADEITRLTGVSMDITVAVDDSQLGVMISSGDLPDLISTDAMLSNLSSSELCYDWQGLIDEYNVDWEVDPMDRGNALSFSQDEGKFYTILSHFADADDWKELEEIGIGAPMAASIEYRHDIYEKLGSPKIETLEDIHNLLLKVKEEYPDIAPLVVGQSGGWQFAYFKQAFGMGYVNYFEQEDKNWLMVINDPRYKEYLKYVNSLYRDGLFTADNYGMDNATYNAAIYGGKAFAFTNCTQLLAGDNANLQENVPDGVFYEMPVVGDLSGLHESSIGWMGTFISRNCKDPETAIRYMQFIHSDEGARLSQWGREGIEYTLDENGLPTFSDEWKDALSSGNIDKIYNTCLYQGGSKMLEAVGRCMDIDPVMTPNYETLRKNFRNLPWITYASPKDGSDELIISDKLFDVSSGVVPIGEAKIILSESDEEFEENFQQMINDCKAVGSDILEAYMNEHIKEAMKVYGVA